MRTRRVSTIDEWLGLEEEKPFAIVKALSTGDFPGYGKIGKVELEELTPKLRGIPVYLGHQVTPDDLVGEVTESWFERDAITNSYCAKAKVTINKGSNAYGKLLQLLEQQLCDSVSLQFKYESMGAGDNVDMMGIEPIELSFVERPVCESCKIEYAQFSKGERQMLDELFDEDGFVRLQHISAFENSDVKRDTETNRVTIKGIALKPGTFNELEYTWDGLKNSSPSLIGQSITVDHSTSVHDVIGQVTDAWADDHEEVIMFEGFIEDEDIAKKIESGLLTAISPEIRGKPTNQTLPIILTDVLFTGISVVARPACKGCRLTTKSMNFARLLAKYFEAGEEATKEAQESEKYLKDDRANGTSTVETKNSEGGNTVTDETKVEAQADKTQETVAAEPEKQVETQEVVAENSETTSDVGTPPAPADGLIEREVKEEIVAENSEEAPATKPEKTEEEQVTTEKDVDTAEKQPVEQPISQVNDELAQKFDTLTTKYAELEQSHKALLAININKKELELGHQVGDKRVDELMSKSTEILNELWQTIKDVKGNAKFGDEPKGETVAVAHTETPAAKPQNPMKDVYDGLHY